MISIQNTIVSDLILEKKFLCNLEKCRGACCVEGDAGAPLQDTEIAEITKNLPAIKPFMNEDYARDIEQRGFWEMDPEGEKVTTCQPGGACSFVFYRNGVVHCAIEEAWAAGKSDFRKPISCHLYPVRVKKYTTFEAVNYHEWDICNAACALGEEKNVPVFRFVKDALIRRFGAAWYEDLEAVYAFKNQNI